MKKKCDFLDRMKYEHFWLRQKAQLPSRTENENRNKIILSSYQINNFFFLWYYLMLVKAWRNPSLLVEMPIGRAFLEDKLTYLSKF